MAVPYTFATATTTLPLSQLDTNFAYFGNAITVAATTTSMTIDSSKNIGIGTASPTGVSTYTTVDVKGASGGAVRVGSAANQGIVYADTSGMNIYTATSTPILFTVNTAEAMRIDASSYLMVGMTTSQGKVSVKSTADAYAGGGLFLQRQANTNGWSILPTTTNDLYFGYNSTDKGYINNSTGAYTAVSDATLKKEIVDISYGINAVKSLRPVEYLMIDEDNSSQKHLGFLAQETQTVLPSCVSEMQGGKLGMDKTEIIPVLVKAIQELEARLAALEAK